MTDRPVAPRLRRRLHLTNLVPALLGPAGPSDLPAWLPGAGRATPRQVVLLVLDGLGWEQLAGARPTWRRRWRRWPAVPITHGRAVDDGHRPHLDHHRAHPRASTAWSATASPSTARSSTSCAGRTGGGDARRRIAARRGPAAARRSSAPPSGRDQGRVRQHRVHAGPPGRRAPRRLADAVDAGRRGAPAPRRRRAVRLRLLRRHRQGRPRVRARRALRRRAGRRRPPGRRRARRRCPPDAALVVTADHGQVDVRRRLLALERRGASTCVAPASRARAGSAGCTPARARREPCSTRPPRPTATVAWVVPVEQVIDEGWFGPWVSRRGRGPPRRRGRSSPGTPVGFDDPGRHRPVRAVGRHGSLTSAEMLVPLLGSRAA